MRRILTSTTAVLILLVAGIATAGQGIWQDASSLQAQAKSPGGKIHYYSADHAALHIALSLAPHESSGDLSHQIELPMPDGSLQRFAIVESPIMEPALAAQYPEVKSFKLYGIDDPTASGRADISPRGFHAMLRTSGGRLFVDPHHAAGLYQSQFRSAQPGPMASCGVHRMESELVDEPEFLQKSANRMEGNLLTYRLAVAATEEYVAAVDGVTADPLVDAQNAIFTAINRVNAIYESDLGIRLILVANDGRLIENGSNVSFSNDSPSFLLQENQDWIDSQAINTGFDYDIGHVFSTAGGGAAFLGAACNNPVKAKGTSGQGFDLTEDSFYIDYVAHEIGHQLNAEHSFNGTTSSCGSGRNDATAFEPGSGSTIMAYAGICLQENLQFNSDATFHAGSIAQIDSFTRGAGNCAASMAFPRDPDEDPLVNNSDPTIEVIPGRVIPANTPFVLDGIADDIDPTQTLTYQWDQMDAGCPTNSTSFGTDNGSNALFRSYLPRDESESARNFPAMGTQFLGLYDDAEVLPCNNRDLDFRLTVRDDRSGQDTEDVTVSIRKTGAAFQITNLDSAQTITNPDAFDVTWNIANTDQDPVNCPNVDIDLLTFSDMAPTAPVTYSIHPLVASVPNIGIASVSIIPATNSHPRARVRVKCSNNIFYDISDADLIIDGTDPTPLNFSHTDILTFANNNPGTTGTVAPVCGPVVDCTVSTAVESGKKSGGSGAFDYLWLLLMTGIIASTRLYRRYGLQ